MNADKFINLLGMTVIVTLVFTVLRRGSAAAQVIRASGESWAGILRAASGQ